MALGIALLLAAAAAALAWALLRPNRAQLDPSLRIETWSAVSDGSHNSNTDLCHWRGSFWLVHASSPYHMGTPRSKLVVRRSTDARHWEQVATLRVPGKDVRDPKFATIGERLHLYALSNDGFMARPSRTLLATSSDGVTWTDFAPLAHPGWLWWRPKTRDGKRWYAAAYWHEHGRSQLLGSDDGREWAVVSPIWEGDANDETAIEFLPDGRMLATARLEGAPDSPRGHPAACTLLATAAPPYERWSYAKSSLTRLDGPVLFPLGGRVFAVARHQPGRRGFFTRLGSMWSRKRTALYLVEPERLLWLSDLPSAGDTSYAGVVVRDGWLYVDYYTSDVRRDVPWFFGMLLPSEIRMARLATAALLELAERRARD